MRIPNFLKRRDPLPAGRSLFHAVSIRSNGQSVCAAAGAATGRRYLSDEAPMLPLEGCDCQHLCRCVYEHFQDRRTDARRESDLGLPIQWHAPEKRNRRGRRVTDWRKTSKMTEHSHRWGFWPALHAKVMNGLKRTLGLHLFTVQIGHHQDSETLLLPPGLEMHILTPAEVRSHVNVPHLDFREASVNQALARGDVCIGAFEDNELVAYTWRALRGPVPHTGGWEVIWDPGLMYRYKAYTSPAYRGLHIHDVLSKAIDQHLGNWVIRKDCPLSRPTISRRSVLWLARRVDISDMQDMFNASGCSCLFALPDAGR